MEYPLPIATAGRAALILLNLSFVRVEGASRLRRLRELRPEPWLWLDDLGLLGFRGALRRRAPWAASWGLAVVTLAIAAAWAVNTAVRLSGDLAADPFSTVLGCSLTLIGWRVWRGEPSKESRVDRCSGESNEGFARQ